MRREIIQTSQLICKDFFLNHSYYLSNLSSYANGEKENKMLIIDFDFLSPYLYAKNTEFSNDQITVNEL